ncbi:hypothetical protein SLEP1_g17042 [Rubroshorea leprosula]|uniref:Uncharacterized protein n=1 Tax=Rubroshorea leprosula TaxID=152421 RepID=A0AAV5J1R8_9ROSI|nr:hypothetical protein SLEP1_g17042 [Rubroshorea leprosula]
MISFVPCAFVGPSHKCTTSARTPIKPRIFPDLLSSVCRELPVVGWVKFSVILVLLQFPPAFEPARLGLACQNSLEGIRQ